MIAARALRAAIDAACCMLRYYCHFGSQPWEAKHKYGPAVTIGGQCHKTETQLPPPCEDRREFAGCMGAPGIGGICYEDASDSTAAQRVLCLTASQLSSAAELGGAPCKGCTNICTIN